MVLLAEPCHIQGLIGLQNPMDFQRGGVRFTELASYLYVRNMPTEG